MHVLFLTQFFRKFLDHHAALGPGLLHRMGQAEGQEEVYFPVSSTKVYFRPALFWQHVLDVHVCDARLEFRLDVKAGQNFCRFPSTLSIEADSSRLQEAKEKALHVVPNSSAREDSVALLSLLRAAAGWGNPQQLALLISTCYVTEDMAGSVIEDAVKSGNVECVATLIKAGVSPVFVDKVGRTPLHYACEEGQEEIAMALINHMNSWKQVNQRSQNGVSAFEWLQANDLAGFARRLQKHSEERFESTTEIN